MRGDRSKSWWRAPPRAAGAAWGDDARPGVAPSPGARPEAAGRASRASHRASARADLGGRSVLSTGEKLLITQAAKRLVVADQLADWILGQLEGPKDGHLLAQMLVWDGMGRTVTAMLKFNGRCAPPETRRDVLLPALGTMADRIERRIPDPPDPRATCALEDATVLCALGLRHTVGGGSKTCATTAVAIAEGYRSSPQAAARDPAGVRDPGGASKLQRWGLRAGDSGHSSQPIVFSSASARAATTSAVAPWWVSRGGGGEGARSVGHRMPIGVSGSRRRRIRHARPPHGGRLSPPHRLGRQ